MLNKGVHEKEGVLFKWVPKLSDIRKISPKNLHRPGQEKKKRMQDSSGFTSVLCRACVDDPGDGHGPEGAVQCSVESSAGGTGAVQTPAEAAVEENARRRHARHPAEHVRKLRVNPQKTMH